MGTKGKREGRSSPVKRLVVLGCILTLLVACALQPAWAEQYKLIEHFGCLDGWGNGMRFPTGIFVQEGSAITFNCDDGVKYIGFGYGPRCREVAKKDSTKIFVADMWNNRVEKYDIEGNLLKRWDEKSPEKALKPYDVVVDQKGSLHMSCQYYDRIQRRNVKGFKEHVNFPNHWNYAGIGGEPAIKTFDDPRGMTVDSKGNIYIADYGYRKISVFDANRNYITSFSTKLDGDYNLLPESEKKNMDPMPRPIDVAVDGQGNVDVGYNKVFGVRKFTSQGQLAGDFPKDLRITGSEMKLGGIAVDTHGNIFVTDTATSMVYKLNGEGQLTTSWGRFGYLPGYFNKPMGIFVDSKDRVYVVDHGNSRVQIFSL